MITQYCASASNKCAWFSHTAAAAGEPGGGSSSCRPEGRARRETAGVYVTAPPASTSHPVSAPSGRRGRPGGACVRVENSLPVFHVLIIVSHVSEGASGGPWGAISAVRTQRGQSSHLRPPPPSVTTPRRPLATTLKTDCFFKSVFSASSPTVYSRCNQSPPLPSLF